MTWLRLIPWRLVGLAVLLALVVCAIGKYGDHRADREHAKVRALWDIDRAGWLAENERIKADNAAREKAATANNIEVMQDANIQLVAIAADRDSLAGRVREYQDRIRRLAAAEATDHAVAAQFAGVASSQREVDEAFDQYDAACRRDAVRFSALQAEVRQQL